MKILYICADLGIPVLGRKGAATHVRNLVAALRRSGHSVVVAAPSATKSPWEEPARLAAPLLVLAPGNATVKTVLSLKEIIERFGISSSLPGEIRRLLYDEELFPRLQRRFKDDPPDIIYERGSMFATAGARLASLLERPFLLELNAPLSLAGGIQTRRARRSGRRRREMDVDEGRCRPRRFSHARRPRRFPGNSG